MDLLLLAVGIAGLWLGTELTIRGALAVAQRHNLSEWVVGLLILSIGSDLPELAVAVDAGIKVLMGQDASGVVVGASIGSVVAQIGLVLGLAALISPLVLPRRVVYRYGAVLLAATVLLFALGYDGHISRVDGLVLVAAYLAYLFGLMNGDATAEAPTQTPGARWREILARPGRGPGPGHRRLRADRRFGGRDRAQLRAQRNRDFHPGHRSRHQPARTVDLDIRHHQAQDGPVRRQHHRQQRARHPAADRPCGADRAARVRSHLPGPSTCRTSSCSPPWCWAC
jgi:Ca2+/Na+ antiporter